MIKTNKKTLEEIIRVDHAGERGAIKIYEGQLLALNTLKQDNDLKKQIEEMKDHELEHYNFFEKELQKKKNCSNQTSSTVGFIGFRTWFWNSYIGEKSYNALYRFCRRGYWRTL